MSRPESDIAVPMRATFFVAGTPIPKARPRVVRGKGQSKFPVTYTPKTTRDWEKQIAAEYRNQCKGIFFDKSIALKVYAEFRCAGVGPVSSIRGDIDNFAKACTDALNAVAFSDDAQITDLHVVKRRARRGEVTGAFIHIEPASEVQDLLFQTREKIA